MVQLVDKIQTSGSVGSASTSFTEEWYLTGESLLECGDFLRQYRNTPHPDSAAYSIKDISFSRKGQVNGLTQIIATVTYSRGGGSSPQEEEDNQPVFSFSAGGGTKHVNYAPLIKREGGPETDYIPDPGQMVGWNGESSSQGFHIAGVDVPTASLKESWEKTMRMGELTTAWRRKIAKVIGTCNNSSFKGWEKGEVMLVDCSFSGVADSSELIKVRFDFAIKLNEKNADIGGVNMGDVEGWQYAWCITKAHTLGYEPIVLGAYVSQVIKYSDFKQLGV